MKRYHYSLILIAQTALSACSTTSQQQSYSPSKLWSHTSCSNPLILRHKTNGVITEVQKLDRLQLVGLDIFNGTNKGVSLSGREVIYSDELIPRESCKNPNVDVTLTTDFEDFASYSDNFRQIRPVYILHLKSETINADKSIICQGVFDDYERQKNSGVYNFQHIYNEERCWYGKLANAN